MYRRFHALHESEIMLEFPIFRISFLLRFECSRDTVFFFPGRQGISGTRHVVVSVRFVSDRVHGL